MRAELCLNSSTAADDAVVSLRFAIARHGPLRLTTHLAIRRFDLGAQRGDVALEARVVQVHHATSVALDPG